jgi:signal transduction histidine kinase
MEQVVQNLLQNAVKYSLKGGNIVVRLEKQEELAILSVTDPGIGIPAGAQVQLFSRFFRADNAEKIRVAGMGIGLYVVKEIVTLHGGTVAVQSEEGKGSTFTVKLPLAAAALT